MTVPVLARLHEAARGELVTITPESPVTNAECYYKRTDSTDPTISHVYFRDPVTRVRTCTMQVKKPGDQAFTYGRRYDLDPTQTPVAITGHEISYLPATP